MHFSCWQFSWWQRQNIPWSHDWMTYNSKSNQIEGNEIGGYNLGYSFPSRATCFSYFFLPFTFFWCAPCWTLIHFTTPPEQPASLPETFVALPVSALRRSLKVFINLGVGVWGFVAEGILPEREAVPGRFLKMISSIGEDEDKWLAEGIAGIQHNAFYMHRSLVIRLSFWVSELWFLGNPNFFVLGFGVQDANNLRDALKYSAQMLSELRTSRLSPHKYYELCEIFTVDFLVFSWLFPSFVLYEFELHLMH